MLRKHNLNLHFRLNLSRNKKNSNSIEKINKNYKKKLILKFIQFMLSNGSISKQSDITLVEFQLELCYSGLHASNCCFFLHLYNNDERI